MEEISPAKGRQNASKLPVEPFLKEPDYTKSLLEIPAEARNKMFGKLRFLYGVEKAKACMPELERILTVHLAHKTPEIIEAERDFEPAERLTERDLILITYGDLIRGEGRTPLATLAKFVDTYNRGAINTLHILPFFPYSSDKGFSVISFKKVDPNLGSWSDILDMGGAL